jgi:pre-mRNA-splicing factor ATP-dependent RNA helicase DHX15/PRP43
MTNKQIGILDYKGINANPLSGEEYTDTYKFLAETWSKLPAYKDREEIIDTIKKNQVILIESSTGSGKTVLVPKYALHSLDYKGRVAVTLPKRQITLSSAAFAATTLDVKLGTYIGYQVKGDSNKSADTKLLYATDGTIVARLLSDPKLLDFDIVVIDEAHERKVQIDLLLFLLRETLKQRPDFKLIIMSATINVDLFKDYYKDYKFKNITLAGGTHYPIESNFMDKQVSYSARINYGIEKLLEILAQIDKQNEQTRMGYQDIMFFVTSQNEAFTGCKRLHEIMDKEHKDKQCKITCNNKILCLELFSGVDETKKNLALNKEYRDSGYTIKVIFTTNVAESSLTVDTIKYVIDNGHELNDSYDPKLRAFKLDKKLITHAQAKQRMGRAGRTGPGICYHLYTKEEFDVIMDRFPAPAIKTSNIFAECLRLLSLSEIGNIDKLTQMINKFIEPPQPSYIEDAKNIMFEKNLIDDQGNVNRLGINIARLVDEPLDGLALVLGKLLNCSHEILKIITTYVYLKDNISGLFRVPNPNHHKKDYEEYKRSKLKLAHRYGDHLSLLKVFEEFAKHNEDVKKLEVWIKKMFLKKDTLRKIIREYKKTAYSVQNKLQNIDLKSLEPYLNLSPETMQTLLGLNIDDRIMYCFAVAQEIANRHSFNDTYMTAPVKRAGFKLNINVDKNSFLTSKYANKDFPTRVIYKKLFITDGQPSLVLVSKLPKNIKTLLLN